MDLEHLKIFVQEAQWFTNLGHTSISPGVVVLSDPEQWKQFVRAGTGAEFGLPHNTAPLTTFPFGKLEWLPTSLGEIDPVHENALQTLAQTGGKTAELKAARLEVHKLALRSMRGMTKPPLLKVGGTDLTEAARGAALFACRMAASEIGVEQPGFWCSLMPFYHAGHWPLGRVPSGEIVVL
jgi:hypothetical protein